MPGEVERSGSRRLAGNVEFERGHVTRFQQIRVDLDRFTRNQPYFDLKHVARVNDAKLIGGGRVKTRVVHPERLVKQCASMSAPRSAPIVFPIESRLR